MDLFGVVRVVVWIIVGGVLRAVVDAKKALLCGVGGVLLMMIFVGLKKEDGEMAAAASNFQSIGEMALCLAGGYALAAVAWQPWKAVFLDAAATKTHNKEESPVPIEVQVQQSMDLDEKSHGDDGDGTKNCDDDVMVMLPSDNKPNAIYRGGSGLTKSTDAREWHDEDSINLVDDTEWHSDDSIDLGDSELSNLPDKPMCPKLLKLSLESNCKLRKIPLAFFTNMPLLKYLNLSKTGIMSLPKSLFDLASLEKLLLQDCEFLMMLPPEVGKLKRLEVLNMERTKIFNLPVEIQELSLLKHLRVSFYDCIDQHWKIRQLNAMIPSGVISTLSQLEELYIDVNPDGDRWDACVEGILNEVCGLTRLRILGFYFPRVELLSKCLKSDCAPKIYRSLFTLIVGGHSKRLISRLPRDVEFKLELTPRCLKYIYGEGVPEDIKKVLRRAISFHLDRHMTVKKLTEFGIENMEKLRCCALGECNEIEVIIDGNDVHQEDANSQIVRESSSARRIGLESLQFLYIYYMKNLKSIWEGPVHKRCLYRLKSLTLSTCPELTTIFTVGLLENLHKLEELTVRNCPAIKTLVSCEEGVKQSANYLPQLRTISLHFVPELVSISSEVCIAPKLEELSSYNCPKLKSLSIKEVSSKHLKKITGEKDWWDALEWKQVQRVQFDGIFVPINADTCF